MKILKDVKLNKINREIIIQNYVKKELGNSMKIK